MAHLLFFGTGILFLAAQTTLFASLPEWTGRPDLVFLLLIYCALRLNLYQGLAYALFFGMAMDIFSGIFLGIHSLMYLAIFFLVRGISKKLTLEYQIHQPAVIAVSYLLNCAGVYLVSSMLADEALIWSWRQVLLGVITLSVLAIPIYQLFSSFFAPKKKRDQHAARHR